MSGDSPLPDGKKSNIPPGNSPFSMETLSIKYVNEQGMGFSFQTVNEQGWALGAPVGCGSKSLYMNFS